VAGNRNTSNRSDLEEKEIITTCPTCRKTILVGHVMWRLWFYSHHIDLLCECQGAQVPVSLETQFLDYPLAGRIADLKRGSDAD
jgi:hypothetical protein